jgi:Protein of unknown function (DUF616)
MRFNLLHRQAESSPGELLARDAGGAETRATSAHAGQVLQDHESGDFSWGRLAFRYDPASALRFSRPRYDVTIWIDASVLIRSRSFARDILGFIGQSGWAMFSHPKRDCIFDEASVSAGMAKYHAMPIQEQVDYHRKTGVKAKSGLYACGVIARKEPLPESLRKASELWWNENVVWTYQDQLSLPFVLNQLKIGIDRIEGDLWNNKWFDLAAHKHDY